MKAFYQALLDISVGNFFTTEELSQRLFEKGCDMTPKQVGNHLFSGFERIRKKTILIKKPKNQRGGWVLTQNGLNLAKEKLLEE